MGDRDRRRKEEEERARSATASPGQPSPGQPSPGVTSPAKPPHAPEQAGRPDMSSSASAVGEELARQMRAGDSTNAMVAAALSAKARASAAQARSGESLEERANPAKLVGIYGAGYDAEGKMRLGGGLSASGLQEASRRLAIEEPLVSGEMKPLYKDLTQAVDDAIAQRQKDAQTAQTRSSLMGTLSSGTLMGFEGAVIDPNTASAATIERGIRSIADKDEREAAAAAYAKLAQTEGSRFYGQKVDEAQLKTYLESANLTQSDYNAAVVGMRESFYGDGAHEAEDAQSYLEQRATIEEKAASGEYNPYVKAQYLYALDKIYTEITGKEERPGEPETTEEAEKQVSSASLEGLPVKTPSEAAEATQKAGQEGAEPKKPGFWEGLTYRKPQAPEAPQAPEVFGPERPSVQAEATDEAAPAGEAPAVQGPVRQESGEAERPSLNELLAAGAPMPPESETPKAVAQTIGEAMTYMMRGQYDRVEGPGCDELNRALENSKLAQHIVGTLTREDQKRVALGNDPAETIAFENIASNGQTARVTYAMIMSDGYPEALRGDALAQMAVWAARAEEMEREGTLGGYDPELPPEMQLPLMERLLTTDEESMAELDAMRKAREELDADMADLRAKTQAQSEQSLKDARAAALSGEMSQEQRALLAESAKDVGYAELQKSESWGQLRARLSEADAYMFSGGYKDSGVALSLQARGVTDGADYEAALGDRMARILNEDAAIAYSLDMTLEDYYMKTGGMDMDRLCELAAAGIAREGASITPGERWGFHPQTPARRARGDFDFPP